MRMRGDQTGSFPRMRRLEDLFLTHRIVEMLSTNSYNHVGHCSHVTVMSCNVIVINVDMSCV